MSMDKNIETPEGVHFHWSAPATNAFGGGMVWVGKQPMTDEDFTFFREWVTKKHAMGATVVGAVPVEEFDADPWRFIDKQSIVGRLHPDYTTAWVEAGDSRTKPRRKRNAGGKGSDVYEHQYLPKGVKVPSAKSREKGMWYRNAAGQMVKGDPGIYHISKGVNVEGPKKGSAAAKQLKGKKVVWNDERELYEIVPA